MAAAEMVRRLLERYALSMEEIDVHEQRCVQVEVPLGCNHRRPIDGCVTAIALDRATLRSEWLRLA
jgi:hypothetical protein